MLSATGARQAVAVAGELTRRGDRIDQVVSGSLQRHRGTAEPIAAAAGVPVDVDPRWNEYDADDILEHFSQTAIRQARPPGRDTPEVSPRRFQAVLETALLAWIQAGEDAPCREPFPCFARRVADALHAVATGLDAGQTAVVCTSGGVLAALSVALLDVPAATLVALNRVSVNAAVTRIAYGRRGATLISFNEQAHLPGSLLTYR